MRYCQVDLFCYEVMSDIDQQEIQEGKYILNK